MRRGGGTSPVSQSWRERRGTSGERSRAAAQRLTHPMPLAIGQASRRRRAASAFTLAAVVGFGAVAVLALRPVRHRALAEPPADARALLLASFARPTFMPYPAGNPPSAAKIALGKRIFEDVELSATGTVACATCHDPKLGFADGEPKGKGVTGRRLARHTPSL